MLLLLLCLILFENVVLDIYYINARFRLWYEHKIRTCVFLSLNGVRECVPRRLRVNKGYFHIFLNLDYCWKLFKTSSAQSTCKRCHIASLSDLLTLWKKHAPLEYCFNAGLWQKRRESRNSRFQGYLCSRTEHATYRECDCWRHTPYVACWSGTAILGGSYSTAFIVFIDTVSCFVWYTVWRNWEWKNHRIFLYDAA